MSPSTSLRLGGVLATLLLAALALLFVTGAIDRSQFQDFSIQALICALIVAVAGLVIGLLLKKDPQ
ncbi:MAG: hypothetical protein E6R07_06205 [Nevskiaceae bacterium]|nr:MAG: hypothetical protein E6R07_06205 [Nevskiaceae bacterium]